MSLTIQSFISSAETALRWNGLSDFYVDYVDTQPDEDGDPAWRFQVWFDAPDADFVAFIHPTYECYDLDLFHGDVMDAVLAIYKQVLARISTLCMLDRSSEAITLSELLFGTDARELYTPVAFVVPKE
jgi:hypothetical protein